MNGDRAMRTRTRTRPRGGSMTTSAIAVAAGISLLVLGSALHGANAALTDAGELVLDGVDDAAGAWLRAVTDDAAGSVRLVRASGEVMQWALDAEDLAGANNETASGPDIVCSSIDGLAQIQGATPLDSELLSSKAGETFSSKDAFVLVTDGKSVQIANLSSCTVTTTGNPILSENQTARLGFGNASLGPMAVIGPSTVAISSSGAVADDVAAGLSLARRVALVDMDHGLLVGLLRIDLTEDGPWSLVSSVANNSLGILGTYSSSSQKNVSDSFALRFIAANATGTAVISANSIASSLTTQEELSAAFASLNASVATQTLPTSGTGDLASGTLGLSGHVSAAGNNTAEQLLVLQRREKDSCLFLFESAGEASVFKSPTSSPSKPATTAPTAKPTASPTIASPTKRPSTLNVPTLRPTNEPSAAAPETASPTDAEPARIGEHLFGTVVVISSLTCCCGVGLFFIRRFQRGGRHHHQQDDHLGDFEMIDEPMFDSFLEGQHRSRGASHADEEVAVI